MKVANLLCGIQSHLSLHPWCDISSENLKFKGKPRTIESMLGVVNHLFRSFSKIWETATERLIRLHLKLHPYHSGELVLLELSSTSMMLCNLPLITLCTQILNTTLKHFQESHLTLPISMTPKVLAFFHHKKLNLEFSANNEVMLCTQH